MYFPPFFSSCVPNLGGILPYCIAGVIKAAAELWKELGQGWERDKRDQRNMQLLREHGVVHVAEEMHRKCQSYVQRHLAPAAKEGVKAVGTAGGEGPSWAVPLPLSHHPL